MALVPFQTNAVMWIDLAELRASAAWDVVEVLSGAEEIDELKAATGVDSIAKYKEVVFAFTMGDQHRADQFLVLAKGSFDTSILLEIVASENDMRREQLGGFEAAIDSGHLFVALTRGTFAIGTERMINRLINLTRGEGKSIRENPEFSEFSINGDRAGRLRYRKGVVTPDFSRFGAPSPSIDVKSITAMDAEMALVKGLQLSLDVSTETQLDAARLGRSLSASGKRLSRNMLVVFLGIDWIFDKIEISHDRDVVRISLSLDDRDLLELRHLAGRINKIKALTGAKQSMIQNDTAPDEGRQDDEEGSR